MAQVDVAMQLLPFSYPQPLVVVTQDGYKVPYQLHCDTPEQLEETTLEEEELGTEDFTEEIALDVATLEAIELDVD